MPPVMIPDVDPETIEHDSEKVVYLALRDQLPSEAWCFHSYPWLRPDRAATQIEEGEADFVVLHPQWGMLILEVKGGELTVAGTEWYRILGRQRKPIKNPFKQGRKSMHKLVRYVGERTGWRRPEQYFVYGYAAVFPHCEYRGAMPADAHPSVLITSGRMSEIADAVREALEIFSATPRLMDAATFKALRDALMPEFHLYQPVGPMIGQASRQIFELTQQQERTFRQLYSSNRVLVEGVAGSGKTFLALDRALSFAAHEKRTLFVCYNSELAGWLLKLCGDDPGRRGALGHLNIRNFHSLAIELAARAEVEFQVPVDHGAAEAFWDDEAPGLLEQAAALLEADETKPFERYHAIVVDEAQDFCSSWWYPLQESLLEAPESSPLYVFRDLHQSLRPTGSAEIPVSLPTRYTMSENCRNTRWIARSSAEFLSVETKVLPRSPEGVRPRLVSAPSAASQRGLVLAEVRRLLNEEKVAPSSIVLIGPRRHENGSLAGLLEIDHVPLVTKAALWREERGILVTTSRAFKGLEAEAVIVYDVGAFSAGFSEADLYVAMTRAKCWLALVTHDTLSKRKLQQAIDRHAEEAAVAS